MVRSCWAKATADCAPDAEGDEAEPKTFVCRPERFTCRRWREVPVKVVYIFAYITCIGRDFRRLLLIRKRAGRVEWRALSMFPERVYFCHMSSELGEPMSDWSILPRFKRQGLGVVKDGNELLVILV